MPEIKRVPILRDRPRYLLYDVNALADLGDELGLNLLTPGGWEALTGKRVRDEATGEEKFIPAEPSLKRIRAIIWAGLRHEDPAITVREVGAMLNPADLGPAIQAYTEAWEAQDVTESADPNVPAPASPASAG